MVRKTANALLEKRSGRAEVTSRIEYRAESVEGTVETLPKGIARGTMKSPPQLDRDEVIVCMVIAFCMGNAVLSIIYRTVG